jgi:hypothetical protein
MKLINLQVTENAFRAQIGREKIQFSLVTTKIYFETALKVLLIKMDLAEKGVI